MHVEDDEGVRRMTFDRPGVKNAFTGAVARELADGLDGADPATSDAVVVTGEGDAFSAGGDVEAMADRDETPAESYDRLGATYSRLAESILACPVPVVARVNGDAVGAGLAVVAACDFAYAAESARFGAAFAHVGLVPDVGSTFLLPRLVGLRRAKELVMTADLYTAAEAAEMGLVNGTVSDADLDATVDDLLETLRARPTRTLGLAKRAMHGNLGPWRDAIEYEALVQSQAYGTPEHEEGVSAFLEGRRPEFE